MSLIRITHAEPALSGRSTVSYINCEDILDISDNYDKNGRIQSSGAKVTLRSGRIYIVNESPSNLALRVSQECGAIGNGQNQPGPQGLRIVYE